MWRGKSYYEGLIAKSLYEPLTVAEQRRLDRALERDSELRKIREELAAATSKIPPNESSEAPDLLPDLRIAIASEQPGRGWQGPYGLRSRWVAVALVIAVGIPALLAYQLADPTLGGLFVSTETVEAPSLSLMQQAIHRSESLVAARNESEAIQILETALRAQPSDPDAALAQMMLADVAFADDRFEISLDAYFALQRNHTDYLETRDATDRARVAERIALLDECRADNFETLHAYNAALDAGSNRFERLESVAARAAADPHGLLAARVVRSMAETLTGTAAFDSADARVAALEQVRDQSTNPLVAARASFEAGRTYEDEVGDPVRAADAYRLAGRHSAYEEAAATAVARLAPR